MNYLQATCKMFINKKRARYTYTCIFKLANELNILIKVNIFLYFSL